MTDCWTSEHIDAWSAYREGQEQRGEPVTGCWEASDMWKRNPQAQHQLAFGVPFVIVNAGMILLGLCSRRPHLMVGRNVQPLLRGSSITLLMFTLDMWHVSMHGIGSVLYFLPGDHLPSERTMRLPHWGGGFWNFPPTDREGVLAWMPVEQLAACYGSAAAVVTLALTASKVRPLPVLGCALGACATTAAMFGWTLFGASFASSIGSSDVVLGVVSGPGLTIMALGLAGRGLTTTAAAAHAEGMCRAAGVARCGGLIAGYGLYKLGLLAGPGGYGTFKLGLTGHGEEEQ